MDLRGSVTIAGVKFGNRLMNGAYIGSKTLNDAKNLAASSSGAVVVGSITVKPRRPNPGKNYWLHKESFYALNSYGMPNGGLSYFYDNLPLMVEAAHAHGKPLVANLAGFSKEEFVDLIKLAENSRADMAELNFGCPNVWDAGKQKRIISYHAGLVKDTLEFIGKHNFKIKISVKISPLPPDILKEVSQAIIESQIVQAVTAANSFPSALTSTGTRSAANEEMLAGMSGRALKPINLGVVRQLQDLLPNSIDIIGCGGISSANDVQDYLRAGAKAVQMATGLVEDGMAVFEKILLQPEKLYIK